jgi:hypothetical protein
MGHLESSVTGSCISDSAPKLRGRVLRDGTYNSHMQANDIEVIFMSLACYDLSLVPQHSRDCKCRHFEAENGMSRKARSGLGDQKCMEVRRVCTNLARELTLSITYVFILTTGHTEFQFAMCEPRRYDWFHSRNQLESERRG